MTPSSRFVVKLTQWEAFARNVNCAPRVDELSGLSWKRARPSCVLCQHAYERRREGKGLQMGGERACGVASGRTGVRTISEIILRVRSVLHRPSETCAVSVTQRHRCRRCEPLPMAKTLYRALRIHI